MKANSEHNFFLATAIWFILIVFWGFAPSFYLSRLLEDAEPLPLHLIIHGVVFTIWVLLYAIQIFLIRLKNYQLHKTLGVIGLVVMILMIPSGIFPSIYKAYVGTTTIDGAGHNVFRLLTAYILFALAFKYRKNGFLHKRFMLGCMVMFTSAAIFRVSFDFHLENSQIFNKGLQILPAIALFSFDFFKLRKIILIDLISVVAVFAIFFFADYFWLSTIGKIFMDVLIFFFVLPFV